MLNKSAADLKEIASSGGGFIIDASNFSTAALKEIASCAASGQGYIILKNTRSLSHAALKEISASGKGHTIFDFMD